MRKTKAAHLLCQAFNQHMECCFALATKLCTDHRGLQWYACDAPAHDTKTGSENVQIERLTD